MKNHKKRPPEAPWRWTDDTAMAIEIVAEFAEGGAVDQDRFAKRIAGRYVADPDLDTTCAIVGGMLAAGGNLPPEEWLAATEPLPS